MPKKGRGHPTAFTYQQNQALREALRGLRVGYASQFALGTAVGIKQQNVGRLLNDKTAGFSYATATAVARLTGYAGVDAFFRARGIATLDVESSTNINGSAKAAS